MSWIEELVLKRNAQISNVYLCETLDPKRISQFKQLLKSGDFGKLCRTEYDRILEYDLQRGIVLDLETGKRLNLNPPFSPPHALDLMLRSKAIVVVIWYVFRDIEAQAISNWLVAWSHDEELYEHKSTVVVFTSSIDLFEEGVWKFVHTISIALPMPEERLAFLEEKAKELSKAYEKAYGETVEIRVTDELVSASAGLTLHEIESACLESFFLYKDFKASVFKKAVQQK